MQIAVDHFNNNSTNQKLFLHFRSCGRNPLQAAYAADELIKENQVQVVVGMETWQEATLVADVGNQAEVPVLSFAAAAISPSLTQIRWPFLMQIATNGSEQMSCITAIVHSYNWRRVIVIYEDDTYGGDSGMLALLSEGLQSVGAEIEYRLVFPPFSSLSDPKGFVQKEVAKLLDRKSRVFIVLQSSLKLATHLFKEAKQVRLMGRDSVWIITDTVSSLLESAKTSVTSSMQGVLGIESYYSEESPSYLDFKGQFRKKFQLEYPKEDNPKPGIYAIRAYDSITTIGQAVKRLGSNTSTPKMLLKSILSSNLNGLSGNIRFHDGRLSESPIFRIMNLVRKNYIEIGFWSSKFGFSESLVIKESGEVKRSGNGGDSMEVLDGVVNWPGNLKQVPKGWAMPTDTKPMKIGVPGRTSFEKFVKVEEVGNSSKEYSGFCIDVFKEVLRILDYPLPYEFEPYNGSYDDLVHHVINKTFDAVVGDITILADRSKYVEFTQPFAESGLSMLVPVRPQAHKAWMFMKPFTMEMWIVTASILIYTMAIVWFLEHQSNPEFRGPWKNQLGTALWFTFSSLFFAHREKIQSNLTRVVVVMWLFAVLILTSSYTANLTSMLTVPRLEPNVTDISWLRLNNAIVGCDGDSFVKNYLKNVLNFKSGNIKDISKQDDYPGEFKSGNITAAFLELPYTKVFLKQYCNQYTVSGPTYRFGGLGFVFPKGSPIAADVSRAILTLSEKDTLKNLENEWFPLSLNCLNSEAAAKTDSLSLQSFWGLYLISGGISTICFLFALLRLLNNYRHYEGNISSPRSNSVWSRTVSLVRYFHNGGTTTSTRSPGKAPTRPGHSPNLDEWSSSKWEYVSPSDATEDFQSSPPSEIEIP
ncbi:hypothetical protein F0562_018362 [Nyssa sinensis]|uniref:Glutamate receptor n=1 Tax=Nyssa sinensis TaxID=561372 RepID=A0A5J4Z8Y6_9ASTE|nr:hypothetical protein F0562_018362 [Nyssa sinensis]